MWHQKHPNEDYQTCNICQQCGKVCTDYNAMKFHVRQVHCDRTLKCTHANCRKVFKTQVALKSHLDIHEGIKNFVCSECGFAFRSKQEMKGHMLRKHSHVKRSIPCEICGKLFRHMSNLKSHFNIHKQQSERQHRCKECNITFKSDVTLKTHMTLHDPSRPFKCSKCPLRYKNKVAFIIHILHRLLYSTKLNLTLLRCQINESTRLSFLDFSPPYSWLILDYNFYIFLPPYLISKFPPPFRLFGPTCLWNLLKISTLLVYLALLV